MTYEMAVRLITSQKKEVKKVNGLRFVHDGFEYRVTYFGGLGEYVGIDRRRIGKRSFEYFSGVGASHCRNVDDVLSLIKNRIGM